MARPRWPGEPGSPERKAAYKADRERRLARAQERYPDASPRQQRAVAAGHAARGALPGPREIRDLSRAKLGGQAWIVTVPTEKGDRFVVISTVRDPKTGRIVERRTTMLPAGLTAAQLQGIIDAADIEISFYV